MAFRPNPAACAFENRIVRLAFAAAITPALIILFASLLGARSSPARGQPLEPRFHLMASDGTAVDSQALRGRPYLLFFGYSRCPEICPTTLAQTEALLAEAGSNARGLPIYFVTIDPLHDTREELRKFAAGFGDNVVGLTGSEDAIIAAAKSFRAYVATDKQTGVEGINHSALVYLVSSGGEVRDVLSVEEPRHYAMYKIRTLLMSPGL
jgi:protein SCO1